MLTCYVVGNGAVASASSELLLEAGYDLRGVYSFDGSLRELCTRRGLVHVASKAELEARMAAGDVDYLFSVNNPWIIPKHVIRAARRGVINFHDSPLPKYAGLHATSWALIHGEIAHATTWHEVTEEIDAGRIYASVPFSIGPDDTALTLNARVLELTITAFRTLIERLARGDTSCTEQPQKPGSYFGMKDRPEAACTLDLTRNHGPLHDLVRALQFGHAPNPMGTAKLRIAADEYVSVTKLRPIGQRTGLPGQVSAVGEGALRVSVADADVEISGLSTLSGEPLDARTLGARVSGYLPLLSANERAALSDYNRTVCSAEKRWLERLLAARPARHPQADAHAAELSVVKLEALAGKTTPEALLSGFAAYLVRVTGTEDFDLGIVAALPDVARPLFAELLPLKVEVGEARGAETFGAFATRLCERHAALGRDGGFARDILARFPVLKAALAQLPVYPIAFSIDAAACEPEGVELLLRAFTDGRAPELVSAHLGARELARMAEHITLACESASEATCLRDLTLTTAEERSLLATWNRTEQAFPHEATAHGLIEAQTDRTPERPAVSFGSERLSYRELDQAASRVARALVAQGAGPGKLVGLCLPRSVELVVGILGILKTGAAYVPIDPSYPEKRVEYLIEDSGVALVVTQKALKARYFARVASVCLDEAADLAPFSTERDVPRATATDPIYVIYTSGSTGNPKGAIISHRALVNHSSAIADKYALDEHSRMLQSASISFDVAAEQIYPVLFRGGEVVVRPDDLLESFPRFGEFARQRGLTAMILPTAFWHEWTAYMEGAGESVPATLRSLSVGTEKALGSKLDLWERLSGGRVRFFEGYGPTETTVTCTMFELAPGTQFGDGEVPIGRALPNVTLHVLDPYGQPTPIGVPGELYVGGAGVGLGYHGRPELSAERFLRDPFANDGSCMYRTGDLVRFREDGQLVYIGRIDSQIKIRGFRVELGEIEAAIAACPGIEQAVVKAQEGSRGSTQLVAYFVASPGARVEPAELISRLASELPEYMVPAAFMRLERLPMTPNLKVDRRALPRVATESEKRAYVAPATDEEARICALWCSLFDVERVSVEDDFFDLGGSSLLAIRLFSEIDRAFSVKLPMSTVLEANTVQKLARLVRAPSPRREGCLVELRAGGERCLFLVHDADGETYLYANLARRMPEGLSVYGIEPHGHGKLSIVHTKVEDMASHYLLEVRHRQPHGPYLLGGLCAGGVLAFEMARQLESQGEEVALLALVESAPPHAARRSSEGAARMGRFRSLRSEIRPGNLAQVARKAFGKLQNALRYELGQRARRARVRTQFWLLQNAFLAGEGWPSILPVPTTREVYATAERSYTARPVAGQALVFRAQDGNGDELPFKDIYVDALFGWRDVLSRQPQVVDVPGGHGECLQEPHVAAIAEAIHTALARLDAAVSNVVQLPVRSRPETGRVAESHGRV